MNSPHIAFHGIISERLKFIDILLKGGRVNEAVKEIAEIRGLDPTNPYAEAYEERIRTITTSRSVQLDPATGNALEIAPTSQVAACSQAQVRSSFQQLPEEFRSGSRTADLTCVMDPPAEGVACAKESQPPCGNATVGRATVLLVDDDELLLMALVELFQDNGYNTKYFTKSEDALQFLKGHTPDLILCDVNLSKSAYGGFTLLEKVEKLGHLQRIPFIFMSGLSDEVIVRAGKEAGADDYLAKPLEPDMLLSVVKGKLRKYRLVRRDRAV
jgi:CheY-like chemotaxis protein